VGKGKRSLPLYAEQGQTSLLLIAQCGGGGATLAAEASTTDSRVGRPPWCLLCWLQGGRVAPAS
jgi:hypothetical protein